MAKGILMIAVLTGDIINSRSEHSGDWLSLLKEVLSGYGTEPAEWEVFRGDSFQLVVMPEQAFTATLHLKAAIKQIQGLDVRVGIGLGEHSYQASKVTESNGSAFIHSGVSFEGLKKNTVAIQTGSSDFDERINLMLTLAALTINQWTTIVAEVVKAAIENPNWNQSQLAKLLQKSQSSISEALKRGGFDEIKQLNEYYQKQIS